MRFPAFLAPALVSLALVVPPSSAAELRLAGSDLLESALVKNLESFAAANDLKISFNLRGSRLGLEALENGEADIGLMVFGTHDKKPGLGWNSATIGYLTSVIVVPADVSLTQINYAQLSGVFGASEQNNYRRWSEIGALGEWAPRAISGMALRRTTGLSLDLFRYYVLQNPELKPTIAQLDSPEEAYQRLLGEEGGIAILPSAPPANLKLKVLLLAKGANEVAYPPTAENLHTGDYPLRMPVQLVFRKGEAGRFSPLLRHLVSDEAAPAWKAAGVTPLPLQARNQLGFQLETM
jgi:phosphate transport system substrate-binding protein